MAESRQGRVFSPSGAGRWARAAAYALLGYSLLDAGLGSHELERLWREWWIAPPIAILFVLARLASTKESLSTTALAWVLGGLGFLYVVLGFLGFYRHRTHEVDLDVVKFETLHIEPEIRHDCRPESMCLVLDPGTRVVSCYNDWPKGGLPTGVHALRTRVRVSYRFFQGRSYDIEGVRSGSGWQPRPWLSCYEDTASVQMLTEKFPFWRLW